MSLLAMVTAQGGLCVYCLREMTIAGRRASRRGTDATREHRHPRSRGGTDAAWNLVAACRDCNDIKGDMTEWEFANAIHTCLERGIALRRRIPAGGYLPLRVLLSETA